AWTEGTPDAKISDPLTGTALDTKWTVMDVGTSAPGSAKEDSKGLTVMADGTGWDADRVDDAFQYISQSIPASGDWVAYVTVTAVPTMGTTASNNTSIVPGGEAGLKVSSPATGADGKALSVNAANFTVADTNGEGVV